MTQKKCNRANTWTVIDTINCTIDDTIADFRGYCEQNRWSYSSIRNRFANHPILYKGRYIILSDGVRTARTLSARIKLYKDIDRMLGDKIAATSRLTEVQAYINAEIPTIETELNRIKEY